MSTMKVFGSFLLGVAVGTATGILIAPDDGKKTRKMLSKKTDELKRELTNNLTKSLDSFRQTYNSRVDEYTKSGHKTLDHLKDAVKVKDNDVSKVKETINTN